MRYARTTVAVLAALFLLTASAAAQGRKKRKLPAAAETVFLPTDPGLIRYQPTVYEGRYLRVADVYGTIPDPKMLSKKAIKRGWDPKIYFIFETSHETSEMRCYIKYTYKRAIDVAQGLAKGEKFTLYGKLEEVETTRAGRVLRFRVFHIERGHEPKPVMTVEFSSARHGRKLYRIWEPKQYQVVYPPAGNAQQQKKNAFFLDIAYKVGQEQKKKSGGRTKKIYAPVRSDRVPYQPKQYVGKSLLIKDSFDSLVDLFPKSAKKLGYTSKTHLLFKTPSAERGSDMHCYVPKSKRFYCDLAEALVKNVKITLYGTLVAYDDLTLLRAKHFLVDRLDVGWEEKPVVEVKFGRTERGPWKGYRFYKPYMYLIDFPPWAKKEFDLTLKCIY